MQSERQIKEKCYYSFSYDLFYRNVFKADQVNLSVFLESTVSEWVLENAAYRGLQPLAI